ncbi:MAG: substrate-binding domain-containing protein [Deltaproteobacteria bacterium]|nr:substrate-binding domain-containing protein [Deltaproteobacteria bacterium]
MRFRRYFTNLVFYISIFTISALASGEDNLITMSTTTSTENSGLLDVLLPAFTADTGIKVKVIAKGTGAAVKDGMDGNVDVIFVHARELEDRFVAEKYGAYRLDVMHNDFIILGPANDPAAVRGIKEASFALKKVAEKGAVFISRGDDSGTHIKEQEIWNASGVKMKSKMMEIVSNGKKKNISYTYPEGNGEWYYSIGQGMGKTLTYAEEKQAYTLTDRGTYLKYKYGRAEGLDLEIMVEGDPDLFNPYGIIPVNPEKYPHLKFKQADIFAKWLVSEKGQKIIADYKIEGREAFFPDVIGPK